MKHKYINILLLISKMMGDKKIWVESMFYKGAELYGALCEGTIGQGGRKVIDDILTVYSYPNFDEVNEYHNMVSAIRCCGTRGNDICPCDCHIVLYRDMRNEECSICFRLKALRHDGDNEDIYNFYVEVFNNCICTRKRVCFKHERRDEVDSLY